MENPQPRSRWSLTVSAAMLLPVLYVLSLGPVVRMDDAGMFSDGTRDFLQAAYFPLEWCYDRSQIVHDSLEWYMDLWR